MNPADRVKRPEPLRTQPVRNWWTVFGPPGAPMPPGMPGAPPPHNTNDPVSRGVEMGYRVIEEYLRQGQDMARTMWNPYAQSPAPEGAMPQPMVAMLRSFSEFASLWMDLMGRAGPMGYARPPDFTPPSGSAGPFSVNEPEPMPPPAPMTVAPEAPAAVAGPPGLTLDLESRQRVEVSVDLRPRSAGLALRVHDLRALEADKPRLTGITLEGSPGEERVTLRLRIPEEHPPGVYSGIILDEQTSLPRGTLTVRLFPA